MGALAWGAAGRREGRLGIALQLIVLALAAGAVFGRQCAASAAPRWRAFLQQRLSVNWAIFATAAGMGAASIVAFPYAYQRLLAALTGEMASDYVRSLSCQAHAVPWMLLRTVAPLGLNIDHDFPSISDPNDPRVWQGALIITALLAFGLIGLWRRWLGGFGVLLALVVIAPTNTVIERGDVVSERNFYLAAAGGACLIAWALSAALAWLGTRAAEQVRREADDAATGEDRARSALQEAGLWTAVLGFCIAAPFTALTVLRNNEWGDAYRLWASAHARSPAKLRVLYNYGLASYMTKRYDEADAAFTSLIAIGEAKAEQKLFRPDETVQVKCFHLGYNMLATVQLRRHLAKSNTPDLTAFKRVDELYRRGIERTAYDPDLAYTYAQFLLQLGRTTDTAAILQHSLNLHPWAEHLCYPLGLAYLENGQFDAARDYLERALNVRDQHTLGVAVEMRPEQRAEILAYLGLARLYKKQRVEAKNAWRDALDVDHGGIVMMLTTLSRTRNPKLKPVQSNPPDALVTALTQTRRDVLEVLYLACDELLNREPRRERTIPKMLRTMADNELRRRGAYQKKRLQFGFLDDPDAE
jgi:tetratricopeptide (TPR) repeat protein